MSATSDALAAAIREHLDPKDAVRWLKGIAEGQNPQTGIVDGSVSAEQRLAAIHIIVQAMTGTTRPA